MKDARWLGITMAVLLSVGWADLASACSVLTEAGQRREERRQNQYLEREADRVVIGTFRADPGGQLAEAEEQDILRGYIEVERRGRVDRYRVYIPRHINCGFPYYYVEDGNSGRFYLKRDFVEDNDRADGVIDNYDYVHFDSLTEKEE